MLSDPPHKKGYHTTLPTQGNFVRWSDLENFKSKINDLHVQYARSDDIERKRQYREELDKLVMLKQLKQKQRAETDKNFELGLRQQNNLYDEMEQRKEANIRRLRHDHLIEGTRQREEQKYKYQQNILEEQQKHNEMMKQSKEQHLQQLRREDELRRSQAMELRKDYYNYFDKQNERKQRELEQDKQFSANEQVMLKRLEQQNKDFFEKIRTVDRKNQQTVDLYNRLYKDNAEKQRAMDYYTVERPYLNRLKAELDKERAELEKRRRMKKDTNSFLLKQIENNENKSKALKLEEQRLEYLTLKKKLESEDMKDKAFQENYKQKIDENLRVLKMQIEENRRNLLLEDCLNVTEAQINHVATGKIDYTGLNSDTLGGVPGLGFEFERKKQLGVVNDNIKTDDKNIDKLIEERRHNREVNDKISTQRLAENDFIKNSSNILNKENKALQKLNFTNEYDFIKFKNTHKPYNIISNTVRFN